MKAISHTSTFLLVTMLAFVMRPATGLCQQRQESQRPLVIALQGSFMAGGTKETMPGTFSFGHFNDPDGQNAYTDHAYVFYQIPVGKRRYPIVMLHGGGQSGKTWETTPDGREGFQNIFLRKGYSVYVVDQPRRGRAGASSGGVTLSAKYNDKRLFSLFRIGDYPTAFAGTQFPSDSGSVEQLMRWATPDTGPYNDSVTAAAMTSVLRRSGRSILFTHSRGGYPGWLTALKSDGVMAIVSFEPGGSPFVFPEGEVPNPIATAYGILKPDSVPLDTFMKLTHIPILMLYGDNIATEPVEHVGKDQWRGELAMARRFAEVINRHGGRAMVLHLPNIGIKGNTHFMMADLNNVLIADLVSNWLHENGLDIQ